MREFFGEAKVLFGKFAEQVPHNAIMVRADGRAHVKNPSDVKKHRDDGSFGGNAYVERRSERAGVSRGESLSRARFGNDIAIAPDVLLYDQNAPRQHKPYRFRRFAGAQNKRAFRKTCFFRVEAGENGRKISFG